MKYVLKPSLEQKALVRIGMSLWDHNDVNALISKLGYIDLHPVEWKKIEEKVTEKVPQLSLPQLLEEKVLGVIKPIGIQIFNWLRYYRRYDALYLVSDFTAHNTADICWTPHNTVDRKKTAEVLVRNENLNVSRRYRLACDNFLENDIVQLWNRLPENRKDYNWSEFSVVKFWSDYMKRGGAGHISYKNLFKSSTRDGNIVAAKCFLQKLTPEERDESLKKLVLYVEEPDVLCSLLSEIEEEEQKKVFKSDPKYVLKCFLEWPWQSFFIGVAIYMWDFLSKDNYNKILRDILIKVKDNYKDYNYQKLFREVWQKSPSALKDSVIERIDNSSYVLEYLLGIKDKENTRLILRDATLTAKKKLIYSCDMVYYISRFILNNEWDFLEFIIRECLPSNNEMLRFKEKFEKSLYYCVEEHIAKNKDQWNQLFCSSDDSIYESDKRRLEVGESSLSKRF